MNTSYHNINRHSTGLYVLSLCRRPCFSSCAAARAESFACSFLCASFSFSDSKCPCCSLWSWSSRLRLVTSCLSQGRTGQWRLSLKGCLFTCRVESSLKLANSIWHWANSSRAPVYLASSSDALSLHNLTSLLHSSSCLRPGTGVYACVCVCVCVCMRVCMCVCV